MRIHTNTVQYFRDPYSPLQPPLRVPRRKVLLRHRFNLQPLHRRSPRLVRVRLHPIHPPPPRIAPTPAGPDRLLLRPPRRSRFAHQYLPHRRQPAPPHPRRVQPRPPRPPLRLSFQIPFTGSRRCRKRRKRSTRGRDRSSRRTSHQHKPIPFIRPIGPIGPSGPIPPIRLTLNKPAHESSLRIAARRIRRTAHRSDKHSSIVLAHRLFEISQSESPHGTRAAP